MKKHFFLLIILIVLQLTNIVNCAAQVKRDSIPTKEKDIISASQNHVSLENSIFVNLYWGGPNLGFVQLKEDNVNLSSVSNIGPFGGSIELMIDNQSSIGLEANYSSSIVNYVNSNFHKKLTRYRITPKYVQHFSRGKLDIYYHLAVGIVVYTEYHDFDNSVMKLPLPAIRTGFGMRYFVTKNLGINFDFALGGPFITSGLSYKLKK